MNLKPTKSQLSTRTWIVTIFLTVVCFGAVVYKLVDLQLVQGAQLKTAAVDQSLSSIPISASRGKILDCKGNVVAESSDVWTVALQPKQIQKYYTEREEEILVYGLARILNMNAEDVRGIAEKDTGYAYLQRKVETDVKDQILALLDDYNFTTGVTLEKDYKRYYPYGSSASTVVGFTGTDGQGLYGVEYQYDEMLSGTPGRKLTATNARGDDMHYQYEQLVEAENGYDVTLTIDITAQAILERYMRQGVEDNLVANGAVAILMEVKTGAIRGLVSLNDFDPNDPFTITDASLAAQVEEIADETERAQAKREALNLQWRNKAVSDTYYPGSVFKIVTGSAGLEEGVVDSWSSGFDCVGYNEYLYSAYGQKISCWETGGHGYETFTQALCNSCNPYFMNVGRLLGPTRFFKYFSAFGFTERTNIDLPGEARSLFYNAEQLMPVELATESFGQNFSITPVQMITAACAVANGGYLVQPHVVEKVTDAAGNIITVADTGYRRQVISKETSATLVEAMYQNATIGTAKNGYVAGYRICGKTGTSEKVDKNTADNKYYVASYCGFAPAEDPQYALLVFFDEPNGSSYYGGAVCGPVFAGIMKELLPYLGVSAKYTAEEASKLNIMAPSVTKMTVKEAVSAIKAAGLSYEIIGDDDETQTVLHQVPTVGTEVPKSGKMVLYTSEESLTRRVNVPDFSNMTLSEAKFEADACGLQLNATGAALQSENVIAFTQDHEENEAVLPGTVVMVYFIEEDQIM